MSDWTIFAKNYAEYEIEWSKDKLFQRRCVEVMLFMHKNGVLSERIDWEIRRAYRCAIDIGDSQARRIFHTELKRRGLLS